jgi:hypothetical protein
MLPILLLVSPVSPLPAQPADAATCSGADCHGVDPDVAGCAGNSTVGWIWSIEARISSTCRAGWARYQDAGWKDEYNVKMYCAYSSTSTYYLDTGRMEYGYSIGLTQRQCIQPKYTNWTKMVTRKYLRVCYQDVEGWPPSNGNGCSTASGFLNPYV